MNGLKRSFIALVTLGVLTVPASVLAQTRTWTTTQDFDQGEFVNLNPATVVNQLQINTWSETKDASPAVLPYLWVACSERGTVVRIATSTFDPLTQQTVSVGDVLGEYWTAPEGCRTSGDLFSGPSRTTVDFDGAVWVGNRNDLNNGDCGETSCGHVVKIGNGLAFQWKDRPIGEDPPNATLDTSSGLGDIKDWPNPDGTCDPGDVDSAADELILVYQPVPPTGTRTIAVDRGNNVWVGGSGNRWHGLIDGQTGEEIEGFEFGPTTCGGYGGLVDCNGVLWSAWLGDANALLLRLDPNGGTTCIPLRRSYGLAADTLGFIWNSRYTDQLIAKLDPDGVVLNNYATGGRQSRGVVVTPEDNDVWIANSFSRSVTRLNSAGTLLNTIFTQTDGFPTGVAVDSDGFVWVSNRDTDTAQRIDPGTNAVDLTVSLGTGCGPYNYSDMTGVNLYQTISPAGVWTDVYDNGTSGTVWETATWTETLGHANSTVRVSARAADVETDLGKRKYRDMQNGVPLTCAQCDLLSFPDCEFLVGRYIQIRVQLNAFCHEQAWPTLQDLTVQADPTGQDCQPNGIPDECDLATGNSLDCDGDSVPDECQVPPICMACSDCNANGVPDACEPDCNANDVPDECDLTAGTSCDVNLDGVPDECQSVPGDCNANGIADTCDRTCGAVGGPCDVTGCGTVTDCNDDCTLDVCEIDENSSAPGGPFFCTSDCDADCNDNGVPDECDITGETSSDCRGGEEDCCTVHAGPGCTNLQIRDAVCEYYEDPCCETSWTAFCVSEAERLPAGCAIPDTVPDECQLLPGDCNGNGINDVCDISCGAVGAACDVPGCGTATDCNDNCTPDECEIDESSSAPGGPFFCTSDCAQDCNENGVPDDCDVPPICATCSDCNQNNIPDVCDADCNANAVPDDCDLTAGSSCDMDGDDVPDECGACCEDYDCRDTMSWLCQFGDYADGVPCGIYECAIAACCLGSTCRDDLNESQCEAIPGSSGFEISLSCASNPCGNGACCKPNGTCLDVSASTCINEVGTFFGNTSCTPGFCDAPIVDCDNDCLDDPPGSTETVLTNTSYACDDSLSRIMNNVLRFQFACPITLPAAGAVEIKELLEGDIPFGPDLSANFTFTLEGTPGFETILRIEENGTVFVNETWYTVRNTGNWTGVAAFQVDYASIYGDADNIGGTGSSDLAAIYNVIVNAPDCSDDSRFDIDTLGCVGFSDIAAAFNYIPSFVVKPSGHDCPGSSQQSQGGGSSPESSSSLSVSTVLEPAESLTADDVDTPATFVAWLPDFVSGLEIPEHQRASGLDKLLRVLVNWAVENLTDDQRDSIADALSDPLRTFADPTIAARSRDMAGAIAP